MQITKNTQVVPFIYAFSVYLYLDKNGPRVATNASVGRGTSTTSKTGRGILMDRPWRKSGKRRYWDKQTG